VSNQDWPGPYWQQNENADAGRRSRPGSHVQDQTPWDDAGFWRSGDRQGGGEERTSRSGNSRGTGRSAGNGAGRFSQTADDLKNRLGIRGSVVGRGRSRADDQADEDFWGESGGGRSGGSAARESSRGSRARAAGNGQDANGYDANGRAANGRAANGRAANGRAANGRAANGYAAANGRDDRNGWDDAQAQGSQENGAGRGGYRGTRRAGRGGGAANGGAANGGAANGGAAYRGAANGGAGYRGAANGGAGYRGAANGGAANGGAGYDENGTGEWSRRTALRERTARIGEGVRTRTQRIGGGRTGDGRGGNGGNGWDGGRGGSRFDRNGKPLTRIERFKRYVRSGDWWRHWTWKKALGLAGAGVAAVLLFGAIGLFVIYEMTPVPTASQQTANWQSTNVYFSNGTQLMGNMDPLIGTTVDRTLLQPGQIPQIMNDAMIAAEDRNFMNEGGISITGLLRSAYEDVAGNGNLQGGSTITMQYAKNYYSGVDTGQNMSTKIKEIFIAMKLAHERSKQWILTSYLNTVPFGPTIDGVGAAAENYFGINLAQGGTLNYEQAAELAAMPNNPSVLSPNPANTFGYQLLQSRWHYVLTNMLRDGNITQQQFSDARFPAYTPPKSVGWSGVNGYLLQMVEQQLLASKAEGGFGLSLKQIATGGYHIVTTFNMSQIRALARSVTAEKQILDQQAAAGSGVRLPGYDRIGAALINPKTGAITAIYGGPGYLSSQKACDASDCQIDTAESPQEVGSSFKPYVLSTAVNENMNVFTSILDGYGHIYIPYSPADQTSTELALSVLQPPAGATNDVVDGNSIGFTLPSGMRYYHFPEGADDPSVDKPLPVNVATATSSDPAFEDLAHRDGITSVINMARDFGVGSTPFLFPTGCITQPGWSYAQTLANCNDFNGQNGIQTQFSPTPGLYSTRYLQDGLPGSPQIALGEAPLTAIEQASTFATLADDGEYHAPHVIASITSSTGPAPQLIVAQHRVLSSAAAADVDWALSFDNNMSGGTAMGTVTYHPGGIIAKTGTLGSGPSSFDAWFVGAVPPQQAQPGEAMAVTLYANDPGNENLDNLPFTPSGMSGSLGGAWPASIWNSFFSTEWPTTSYQQVNQVFPTVNGFPFVAWIQAKAVATKLPNCKPGQFKNCKPVACKPGLRFGQPCTGGNPSPNPSCLPFAGQCNNPSPNPSGNPSPNPSGSVSPSPSTSCTPPFPGGTCVNSTAPGGAADQTRTTAALTAAPAPPPFVGAEDKSALLVASLAVTGVVT
jgi:membrane peptidoglycan carboxypeptidase